MSLSHLRITVSLVWFVAMSMGLAAAVSFGWSASLGRVATLFLLGCLPLLVFGIVFRGRPPQTIAEVIYDARQDANPSTAGLTRIEEPLKRPSSRPGSW